MASADKVREPMIAWQENLVLEADDTHRPRRHDDELSQFAEFLTTYRHE
jgi:hypothetical protein